MEAMETRIAEIIKGLHCDSVPKGFCHDDEPVEGIQHCTNCEECTIKCLQALFTEQQVEALDVAFDKGFDTGKVEGLIEAKQQQSGQVEALKEVMVQAGEYIPFGLKAKIDSIL